jgi:hypothetical protein
VYNPSEKGLIVLRKGVKTLTVGRRHMDRLVSLKISPVLLISQTSLPGSDEYRVLDSSDNIHREN